MKTRNIIASLFALCCFALCPTPKAFGVSPAPDGGYPGLNTAEGTNALKNLTSGSANTAVGWSSLESITDGSFCTGVGAGTLLVNTASENTAIGAAALLLNTTGSSNTAVGAVALLNNTDGGANTADGAEALQNNTSGNDNTAIGRQALLNNTTGGSNTAMGESALFNNIDGGVNTGIGVNVLQNNTHGHDNTAIGVNALGGSATGNFNIGLGSNAGVNVTSASNVICIGADGNNVDNACYIGQIFGATSSGGTAVLINSNGRLGTVTSSRRFKQEIKPMDQASEALFALRPVTFRYKKEIDPQGIPQFGLVAEEVAKVNPDLVVRDKDGKPYSVRYEQVNAMLLNEFLKEHKKVEEQQSKIESQQMSIAELKLTVAQQQKGLQETASVQNKEIETLIATVREQAAQIQKVSARLETSQPKPQVAVTRD
jgi:Chaperone of endosialidase